MASGVATSISVAYGDGIGPEIMEATLEILERGGAQLAIERVEIGESVHRRGFSAGIEPSTWESLRRNKVLLKAPITTPQSGGFKSLNVTLRKTLGLFANIRPCVSYHPFVRTKHSSMDVVIVRENEEDLYAGIEYRLSDEVYECLKLISIPGSEKIVRYAFEYARQNNRRKVSCFTKDNIMKMTDGCFHKTFERIAGEYPELKTEHFIVDIGAARLADTPEIFDVIVMPNLYGDILSDVAAQIAGSVGLAGSANVGESCAMFEAIHGSAPAIAGQGVANPSGLLLGAVMMLLHVGQADAASRVHNAWLKTIEDGVHTFDIFRPEVSRKKVGTQEFAQEVITRLGESPQHLKAINYPLVGKMFAGPLYRRSVASVPKTLIGLDVFLQERQRTPDAIAKVMQDCGAPALKLSYITNGGVKVWPQGAPETFCSDLYRCRFEKDSRPVTSREILALLGRLIERGLDFVKTEHLYDYDGEPGYSLGQGE